MNETNAAKYGMVIDLDKCTGCGTCMVSCYSENNVPFKKDESDKLDSINWIQVIKISNRKPWPDTDICYLPMPCMHCGGIGDHGHPPCVMVCPATATDYDHSTGVVSQIYTRCFGCRYCQAACPYHTRKFNWWDPVWPGDMENYLSPNVSARTRGVVEKCSFCFHRYQLARDKAYHEGRHHEPLGEKEYQPACVESCPSGAMTFGNLNNPEHAVYKLRKSPYAFRLLERLQTHPKVYYLSSREWVRRAGDNYLEHEETGSVKRATAKNH